MEWADLFKILSILSAAVFGALGLLTEYKDDKGKITRWGRIALSGILLSSLFSLVLFILEANKVKQDSVKAIAKAEAEAQVLQAIQRDAQTTVNQQKETLADTYRLKKYLDEALEQQRQNLEISSGLARGMKTSIAGQRSLLAGNERLGGELEKGIDRMLNPRASEICLSLHFSIPADQPPLKSFADRLRPGDQKLPPFDASDKELLDFLTKKMMAQIWFYKRDEKEEPNFILDYMKVDLQFNVSEYCKCGDNCDQKTNAERDNSKRGYPAQIAYNANKRHFEFSIGGFKPIHVGEGSGRILRITDFAGTDVFVQPIGTPFSSQSPIEFDLIRLTMRTDGLRSLSISNFKKVKLPQQAGYVFEGRIDKDAEWRYQRN